MNNYFHSFLALVNVYKVKKGGLTHQLIVYFRGTNQENDVQLINFSTAWTSILKLYVLFRTTYWTPSGTNEMVQL
jgi:hypothetical protein